MINIHSDSLTFPFLEMFMEFFIFAGNYCPTGAGTHLFDHCRHNNGRKMFANPHKHLDEQFFNPAKELRYTFFLHQIAKLIGNTFGILGAETLIDHFSQQDFVMRVSQQAFQLILNKLFLLGQQLICSCLPVFRKLQGLLNGFAISTCVH